MEMKKIIKKNVSKKGENQKEKKPDKCELNSC